MDPEHTDTNEATRMEHAEALRIQAPSRYLQGELPPSVASAFEEHFFGCPACAEEITLENAFAENVRAVFLEESRARLRAAANPVPISPADQAGRWGRLRWAWAVPLAVAACLLVAIGIQNANLRTEIARLSSGDSPYPVALTLARGKQASVPGTS